MKYITKNSTWKELYEAYKSTKEEVLRLKRLHESSKDTKSRVIKNKNDKYDKLSYKLFKEKQKVYGKDKHINNLQRHIRTKVVQARNSAYEKALAKVKERDGRIIDMYTFLAKMNTVSSITKLSLVECSFLLWAGTYNFYSMRDFKRDCADMQYNFYAINNRMAKKGYIVALENRDASIKIFALTGTGLNMFEKIDKFTKKQFE